MSLPPPTFRIILALVGASLVLWGAKGEVVTLPGVGTFSFFEMTLANAWTLVAAAILVVVLSCFGPQRLGWGAFLIAVGAVAFFAHDIHGRVQAMKDNELLAPMVTAALRTIEIRPGAVAILSGLVIQAIGLCLKRRNVSRAA